MTTGQPGDNKATGALALRRSSAPGTRPGRSPRGSVRLSSVGAGPVTGIVAVGYRLRPRGERGSAAGSKAEGQNQPPGRRLQSCIAAWRRTPGCRPVWPHHPTSPYPSRARVLRARQIRLRLPRRRRVAALRPAQRTGRAADRRAERAAARHPPAGMAGYLHPARLVSRGTWSELRERDRPAQPVRLHTHDVTTARKPDDHLPGMHLSRVIAHQE